MLLLVGSASAQTISYQSEEKPLSEILDEVSERYQLYFSYSSSLLASRVTSCNIQDAEVDEFLNLLLEPLGLRAVQNKDNYFFIQRTQRTITLIISSREPPEPLAYATASSSVTHKGSLTDPAGFASFSFDPLLDTSLLVHYVGFATQEIPLNDYIRDTLVIEMDVNSFELNQVVIEYHNQAITLEDLSYVKLRPDEMKVLPGLPEADVLLSVQMIPGMESNDETASGINVRGGGKDELIMYWDRIPVYQQGHFFGTLTSFIPSAVNEINAYKNYVPVSFTGATSGLLDIHVYDSIPDQASAVANLNLTHGDLMLRMPIKQKASVLLGGRLSFNQVLNSPAYLAQVNKLFSGTSSEDFLEGDGEGEEVQADLNYNDLNAKVIWQISDQDYFSVSGMLTRDNFEFATSSLEEDEGRTSRSNEISFQGFNAFYQRTWNGHWSSTLSISRSQFELDNVDREETDEQELDFEISINNVLNNTELKVGTERVSANGSKAEIGYQLNLYENSFDFREQSEFEEDVTDFLQSDQTGHGVFVGYQYRGKDRLRVHPQLRGDYFPELGEARLNPILNVHYRTTKSLWLKSSYGHYNQALRTLNDGELDVSNVSGSVWLLAGNEDLSLLGSRQASLGGVFTEQGWLIDVDFYWKRTNGLSSINQFQRSDNIGLDFSLGSADTRGVDVMIRKKFGRYQSWLSYTYSQTTSTFNELQSEDFPSSLDRPHQFRWVHNLYLNQFEVAVSWHYKSGTPYSQPTGLELITDEEESYYELQYEEFNDQRLASYHRMDISVWYKFPKKRTKLNGLIGIAIQNVYNRENVWQRFFFLDDEDDDQVPEVVSEARYFLGFTPNISLKVNFN